MANRTLMRVMIAAAVGTALACGDDDDGTPAGAGGTGTTGGTGVAGMDTGGTSAGTSGMGETGGTGGGMGGDLCVNPGEFNPDCPDVVGPFNGACAPKGACCSRSSNKAKLDMLGPDDNAVFEYRLNFSAVTNHPMSTSIPALLDLAAQRAQQCAGEQCLLWRFTMPRMGGMMVDGPGMSQIGIGRYNCDGTFSYYGAGAAPEREGHTDPARWQAVTVPTTVDAAATDRSRQTIAFADNANREVVCSPFLKTTGSEIDWELCTQGFDILTMDNSDGTEDCKGSYLDPDWEPGGMYVAYAPLKANNADILDDIGINFCQLLSFGLTGSAEAKAADCATYERCMPGTDGCSYVKLPDSLCPETDAEKDLFGCHLGAEGNINNEMGYPDTLNCTQEAPTTVRDPAAGATDEGQCCDPMGMSATLPACNAFRILNEYTAAAAEITDDAKSDLPPKCM